MSLGLTLAIRFLTLAGVVIAVLFLVVITLGATGFSDKILNATIREELRGYRESLAQTVRDPQRLEDAIEARRKELEVFYGVDMAWYKRLPDMVRRVVTLDLGEARTLRSFSGSPQVASMVLERLPYTLLLVGTSTIITTVLGLWLGVKLATRAGTGLDRAVSYLSAGSYALPAWWTGILLILFLAFQIRIFPSGGLYSSPPPEFGLLRFLDLLRQLLWCGYIYTRMLISAISGPVALSLSMNEI